MADEIKKETANQDLQNFQQAVDYAVKEQKKKKRKKRLIIFAVLAVIIIAVAVIANQPKNYDFDNPAFKVTVDKILSDFKANSADASEKYSDQVIAVTGKVGSIQDSYIVIDPYDDDNWLYSVDAYMENAEDMKKIIVGDTITVEGVCDKTTLFGDVKVSKCVYADKFAVVPDYANAIKISAEDLYKAYKENQVKADEHFKGQVFEITAKVSYIDDDYAVLEPEKEEWLDLGFDIQINFENNEEFKKVQKGKKCTIVGECYGSGTVYTVKICRAIVK
ncbi:MAG: hypothetical protein IJU45_08040 [Clostridia bacterium]|nr:hypothetical protein [Clostridia bacterium]